MLRQACIESFHSIIKKELIYHQNYKTREEAMFSIVAYLLTFYNSKRVHSELGKQAKRSRILFFLGPYS
ncbi:TPA: IS3 family transposase [Staphylococcus pseudintermedius]|nr:IS3 family transposase [Staphylococcus pseudintermedius]HAR6226121.1 IS3 family transposase [Staphylococcus pseudintermedius]HAR6596912.1 IS3 family transposase [Staphylococcus pseudintermedius]